MIVFMSARRLPWGPKAPAWEWKEAPLKCRHQATIRILSVKPCLHASLTWTDKHNLNPNVFWWKRFPSACHVQGCAYSSCGGGKGGLWSLYKYRQPFTVSSTFIITERLSILRNNVQLNSRYIFVMAFCTWFYLSKWPFQLHEHVHGFVSKSKKQYDN